MRISLKQQKRDLKKELAQATSQQVLSEMEARQVTARMAERAMQMFEEVSLTLPAMRIIMQRVAARSGVSEPDSGTGQ